MTPQFWLEVGRVFLAAQAVPLADRSAWLDRECADDRRLRAEVVELLAHDDRAEREGFLARTESHHQARTADSTLTTGVNLSVGPPTEMGTWDTRATFVVGAGSPPASSVSGRFHSRLRIGVLVILAGFGLFLLKNLFVDDHYAGSALRVDLWAHVAVVLVTMAVTPVVWCRRALTMRQLRTVETILLVATTIFFAVYQAGEFRQSNWRQLSARGYEPLILDLTSEGGLLRWCAVMVCYGFLVPNTWRRCALLLGAVALCPLAVTSGVGLYDQTLPEFWDVLGEMTIWLSLAWVMAVYGSHKITQLRRQAVEARQLGQYHLRQPLGSGGMGEVWLGEHQLLKRPCAIKLIRPDLLGDPATVLRFQREVRATAMLANPNTVRIYDYGMAEDGTFYYTMEYIPGLTLEELVRQFGPLPPGRAVRFLRRACSALREAHALGLIHRDIKPGNFIVSHLGGIPDVLKLLDFGLVHAPSRAMESDRSGLRAYLAGTPGYLSPEQAAGHREVDARSDLYSLGAVGYFLLSGRPPFAGQTVPHLMVAHLEQAVPPLGGPGAEVPADLEAVIRRCLEKEPCNRYPDVQSLEQALAGCGCADDWTDAKSAQWWQEHPARDLVPPTPHLSTTVV